MASSCLILGNSVSHPPCLISVPNGIGIQKLHINDNNSSCKIRGGLIIRPPSCLISPKAASRSSRHHSCIAAISPNITNDDDHTSSVVSNEHHSTSTISSRISPWLMLSPSFLDEDNNEMKNMVYNFYSIKDDKVISINKRRDPASLDNHVVDDDEPSDDSMFVGSSHGWLALYNPRNHDLFLSNPLTRCHIKLPPFHEYLGHINKHALVRCVKSVVLSSPPDEQDCVAVMNYASKHRLAFCYPGRLGSSTGTAQSWTPISRSFTGYHLSCVYSSRPKLFYSLAYYCSHLEVLDLVGRDPSSHRRFTMSNYLYEKNFLTKTKFKYSDYNVSYFLVVAESSANSELLLVTQVYLWAMHPDGSSPATTIRNEDGMRYPYKTIEFTVQKYDPERNVFTNMEDSSLDGLAIFIGNNHSFAIRASDFPELKPDSIYFTDVRSYPAYHNRDECNFGGHDIGIYDYKDKTFSSCYYPLDVQSIQRIEPAPMWFTPSIPL